MPTKINTVFNNSLDSDYIKRKNEYELNKNKKLLELIKNKKNSDYKTEIYINTGMNKTFSIKSSSSQYTRKKIFQLGNHGINNLHKKDSQLYNPFDATSLSSLSVYDGDLINDKNVKLSSMMVNGKDDVKFEPGIVLLELKDLSKLELFKQTYNAQVLDELNGYYRIKVDFDKAPLEKLEPLLQEYNKLSPINIDSIEFSSVASLKTFIIMLDFLVNNKNYIKNIIVDAISLDLPYEPTDLKTIWTSCAENSRRVTWSFRDTNLPQAWDMSIGSKVNIAWLETNGFKPKHPEISRRILDYGNNNVTTDFLGTGNEVGTSISSSEGYKYSPFSIGNEGYLFHGHYALMTCCAEKNNDLKTVGSSPNVNVAPYSFEGIFSMATAIRRARDKKVDIIGINQGMKNYIWGAISVIPTGSTDNIFQKINFFSGVGIAEREIYDARNKDKISVIVAAHNYGENINGNNYFTEFFPAVSPDVITVGNIGPSTFGCDYTPFGSTDYTVAWNPDAKGLFGSPFLKNGLGSNYGKNDMVWAPGEFNLVSRFQPDVSLLKKNNNDFYKNTILSHTNFKEDSLDMNNVQKIYRFGGTSASTPFTVGIIALMKSRNPDLTPSEIEDILYKTNFPKTAKPHENMKKDGFTTPVKIIDAKLAVEEAIKKRKTGSTNPNDYKAFSYPGYFKLDTGTLSSNTTNNQKIGTIYANDKNKIDVLRTASDYEFLQQIKKE